MRASVHVSSTILGAIALLVGHRTRPDPEPAVRGHSHDDTNPGEPRCESRDAELGEDTQRDAAHASCATTRTPRFLRYYRPASAIGKARRGPARPAPPNAASAQGGLSEARPLVHVASSPAMLHSEASAYTSPSCSPH